MSQIINVDSESTRVNIRIHNESYYSPSLSTTVKVSSPSRSYGAVEADRAIAAASRAAAEAQAATNAIRAKIDESIRRETLHRSQRLADAEAAASRTTVNVYTTQPAVVEYPRDEELIVMGSPNPELPALNQTSSTARARNIYSSGNITVTCDDDAEVIINGTRPIPTATQPLNFGLEQTSRSVASPAATNRGRPISSPSHNQTPNVRPVSPARGMDNTVARPVSSLGGSTASPVARPQSAVGYATRPWSSSTTASPARINVSADGNRTKVEYCCDENAFSNLTTSPSDCCGQKIRLHVTTDGEVNTRVRIY